MLEITPNIHLDENELSFSFARSPGPGGQNVNKVETAVLLRFNVAASTSLSEETKARIQHVLQHRLTRTGDILIKANTARTQERNKKDAIERLLGLLRSAAIPPKKRKKTRVSYTAKQKRMDQKRRQGDVKKMRKVKDD